jgi:hypothetical protein
MKRRFLASGLLLAIGLLLYIAIPAFQRAGLSKEAERAAAALADCYRFVCAGTMDPAVSGQPAAMPATLDEVPGWEDHVSKADPATRALYKRIAWHPPHDPSGGDAIASIELPDARAVLLPGGSAFTVRK